MLVCPTSCLFFPKYHQCFGLLFNSQCNFWFVTALSSPGAGGHYFGRQGVTSSYYSYSCCHCHRCHIGECLLVLPEVHLLRVLPGCPSGTRQKTWSQQNKPNLTSSKVTRGELWPEVSAWRSPRTQRRHAVQRLIARSTHTVLSVSVINLSRYSESSTEVFWWNASRDNTFSSTWHSLAFFIFSVFIWFTAFLLTLLCFHSWKHMWGFRVLSLLPSFSPGGKDLGNDLNFLSFEIVKTNWIHFWHSKAKTLLSIHRNPYTSYTTACIVKTGDRVIFWPSNLKLIFWS